jgi:hypothetical protein
MSNRTTAQRNARRLMKVYDVKAHGSCYTTVLRLVREQGLDGAIEQLEAWGMKPQVADAACPNLNPLRDDSKPKRDER